jgi:hypothetical protein
MSAGEKTNIRVLFNYLAWRDQFFLEAPLFQRVVCNQAAALRVLERLAAGAYNFLHIERLKMSHQNINRVSRVLASLCSDLDRLEPLPSVTLGSNISAAQMQGGAAETRASKRRHNETETNEAAEQGGAAETRASKRRHNETNETNKAAERSSEKRRKKMDKADDAPYATKTEIYDCSEFTAYIEQVAFQRQKNFALDDHQFVVNIIPKTEKRSSDLKLKDILDVFHTLIIHVINKLRDFYDHARESREEPIAPEHEELDFHRQIYCVVKAGAMMERGISIGNYSIQQNPSLIATTMIEKLYSYLNSNQTVPLNKNFMLYFKVLSVAHALHRQKVKKNLTPVTDVGHKNESGVSRCHWKLNVPIGFPSAPKVFAGQCFFVAMILGVFRCRALESGINNGEYDAPLYWEMEHINHRNKSKAVRAGKVLLSELQDLLSKIDYKSDGLATSYEESAPKVCDLYGVQVTIFNEDLNYKIGYSYPPSIDLRRCQIFLLQSKSDIESMIGHVDVITNLKSFQRKFGWHCLGCNTVRHRNKYHNCHGQQTCFACRHVLQVVDTCKKEAVETCDSRLVPSIAETCGKCKLSLLTLKCREFHKKVAGKKV